MPYAAHVAWVAVGKLPGGEDWTCTIRTVPEAPPIFEGLDLAAGCNVALQDWEDFYLGTLSWGTGCTLDRIQGYVYGADGTLVEQATSTDAGASGNVASALPNQAAVCISLQTGQAGRSRRGRIYVPILGIALTAGRIPTARQTAIADSAAILLQSARGWGYASPPGGGQVVVASATYGYNTPVSALRVGDVVDTQQRRRESLVEAYATRALP